jgi:hypothetical protein
MHFRFNPATPTGFLLERKIFLILAKKGPFDRQDVGGGFAAAKPHRIAIGGDMSHL